jgi:hypothetical protein
MQGRLAMIYECGTGDWSENRGEEKICVTRDGISLNYISLTRVQE